MFTLRGSLAKVACSYLNSMQLQLTFSVAIAQFA